MSRRRAAAAIAAALVLVVLAGVAVAWRRDGGATSGAARALAAAAARPGRLGVGDPLFPDIGNGGYDVRHYALDLRWHPHAPRMDGRATITAEATQALSSFTVDLAGMEVARATLDGAPAKATREGDRHVRITPAAPLADGDRFTVVVTYGGPPHTVGPVEPLSPGWFADDTGDVFTVFEPDGAATLFPVNDHPSDKATYRFRITAPAELTVVASGRLVRSERGRGVRTWTFDAPDPMASYLVQLAIGDLHIVTGTGPHGLPLRSAVDRDAGGTPATLGRIGAMIDFYDDQFGPFPFVTYGALVPDRPLGFALETQTLTIFGEDAVRSESVVAHELAHQWFGDDVSLGTWRDIWLNEGFATYAEWLWEEHRGGRSVDEIAARVADDRVGLDSPPARPTARGLFGPSVYGRGALTLYVLRETIGDADFSTLLHAWVERYGGRSATTADFEALAEEVAGRDLTPLFDAWLRADDMPRLQDWLG